MVSALLLLEHNFGTQLCSPQYHQTKPNNLVYINGIKVIIRTEWNGEIYRSKNGIENILIVVSCTQDKCLIFYFVYYISEFLDMSIKPGLATETREVEGTVWMNKKNL